MDTRVELFDSLRHFEPFESELTIYVKPVNIKLLK